MAELLFIAMLFLTFSIFCISCCTLFNNDLLNNIWSQPMHSELPWEFIELTIIQQHQIIRLESAQLNMSIVPSLFTLLLDLLVKSSQKSFFIELLQLLKPFLQGSAIRHSCERCYAQTKHDVFYRHYSFHSIDKPKRCLSHQFLACCPISP